VKQPEGTITWASTGECEFFLQPGDIITFAGVYQRPRWWQLVRCYKWWRGERPLQRYHVTRIDP